MTPVGGLVCAPLRTERVAVAGRLNTPVLRSGRGPTHRLTDMTATPIAIAVTGVAGALDPHCRSGTLIVADEVRSAAGTFPCRAAPLLWAAVRRRGVRAWLGSIVSTPTMIDNAADRAALAATGALAVDTESAFLAADAMPGTTVVIRAIVDTPALPLMRPGTPWRGLRALSALRAAAPVLDEWALALADERVILLADTAAMTDAGPDAVAVLAAECDLVLLVNVSIADRRLTEQITAVAGEHRVAAYTVTGADSIDLRWLPGARRVALIHRVSESASEPIADEIVGALSGLGPVRTRRYFRNHPIPSKEVS